MLKLRWRCAEMALWSERRAVCGLFSRPWRVGGVLRRKAIGAEDGGALDGGLFTACRRFGVTDGANRTCDVVRAAFEDSGGVTDGTEIIARLSSVVDIEASKVSGRDSLDKVYNASLGA